MTYPMTAEMKFCQSCGMPLTDDNKGTNADGSINDDYCIAIKTARSLRI